MMASDDNEEFSGSDSDDGFSEDMEALRRACILAGTNTSSLPSSPSPAETANSRGGATATTTSSSYSDDEDDGEDDLKLVRSIQERFADLNDEEPLTLKPLCSIHPVGEEDNLEDDLETLRAIQRRFASYNDDSQKESTENSWHHSEQVGVTNIASEKETSNNLFVESSNAWEGFPNCVDKNSSDSQNSEACSKIIAQAQHSNLIKWQNTGAEDTSILPVKESGFPNSAQAFINAIKKNRSFQKLLRAKLMHIEARVEEIRKLKDRVKILKDFQAGCRKRTGRALSQKKDARVQLISLPKIRANAKLNSEKKSSAMYYGPAENCQVANYQEALKQFLVFLDREKWTKEEKGNLSKGVKQQFQEMILTRSLDLVSGADGSLGDSSNLDSIFASIRDHDITPENMRLFIPMVNWDQLASMYVPGRSGAACQSRWLNCDDPLINQNPWSTMEDKKLLHVLEKGLSNWIDIAVSLGTNRTPFQCLARYQRSLNASILRREWTEEEDNQLRAAVEAFGERNWQAVASAMEGRTGAQCSNRWKKTLNPARKKVGRWTPDEDKRLKVAVMLFGPKTWNKIAQFVPGRTQVQCRERWVNSLDPSVNWNEWTEEEDLKLQAAISEHGYCWSSVATCVPRRTDNQCWRRWKVLAPEEVPLLQAARKLQKNALMSNFVDRESERPALGPNDFIPLPAISAGPEHVNANHPRRQKRRSRRREETTVTETPDTLAVAPISNGEGLETSGGLNLSEEGNNVNGKKRRSRSKPKSKEKLSANDTASKEKARKLNSKNDESCETECPLSCLTDPSLSLITIGEGVGELGRDDGGASQLRKASKLQPRRRSKHMEGNGRSEHLEENGVSSSTYGEDVNELSRDGEDDTRPKKASKPPDDVPGISISNHVKTSIGKKSKAGSTSKGSYGAADVMDQFSSLSNAKSLMTRGKEARKRKRESPTFPGSENACKVSSASEGNLELQNGNAGVEEQIQNSSSPVWCLTPDSLEIENSKALEFRGHDKHKTPKDVVEEEDNDLTIATFLKQSHGAKTTLPSSSSVKVDKLDKKGIVNAQASAATLSSSNKLHSAEAGDEMTLAVFCNKLKKRKTNNKQKRT